MKRTIYNVIITIIAIVCITGCSNETNNNDKVPVNVTTEHVEEVITTTETEETDTDVNSEVVEASEATTEEIEETTEVTTEETTEEVIGEVPEITYDFNSVEAISEVCGLRAPVQDDVTICYVHTFDEVNPYDVTWDYGPLYEEYVAACDWSLVFDADFYMESFPMLALQYNYDEELLLRHFQTVGIHEGRQGSADFNIGAYFMNCDTSFYDSFEYNFEGYYFYYMLNYETEKDVNTVTRNDGKPVKLQYNTVMTALQAEEFEQVNEYREEVGAEPLIYDAEFSAFSNWRCYINCVENWDAHDWCDANLDDLYYYNDMISCDRYSENNVDATTMSLDSANDKAVARAGAYAASPGHYEAMINTDFVYFGTSNCYIGENNRTNPAFHENSNYIIFVQDIFTNTLSTPTNP